MVALALFGPRGSSRTTKESTESTLPIQLFSMSMGPYSREEAGWEEGVTLMGR